LNATMTLPPFGFDGKNGASTNAVGASAKSPVQILETLATCFTSGCWQQECDDGIAEDSQFCTVFLQQLCSSAVISRSGTLHAISGVALTAMIKKTAANCDETLRTISILPGCANRLRKNSGRRLDAGPPRADRCYCFFSASLAMPSWSAASASASLACWLSNSAQCLQCGAPWPKSVPCFETRPG